MGLGRTPAATLGRWVMNYDRSQRVTVGLVSRDIVITIELTLGVSLTHIDLTCVLTLCPVLGVVVSSPAHPGVQQ
eukprot:5199176-Pyramimonas_sp.AAC.2